MNIFTYDSDFGNLVIAAENDAIVLMKLNVPKETAFKSLSDIDDYSFSPSKFTDNAAKALEEYFAGKRKEFDLPLRPKGTDFQRSVWNALMTIPYGETRSYMQVAQMLGNPKACRAVGLANNKNPIWIIIPCHRVIGSDGSLVGYGGGLETKKTLLSLESETVNSQMTTLVFFNRNY